MGGRTQQLRRRLHPPPSSPAPPPPDVAPPLPEPRDLTNLGFGIWVQSTAPISVELRLLHQSYESMSTASAICSLLRSVDNNNVTVPPPQPGNLNKKNLLGCMGKSIFCRRNVKKSARIFRLHPLHVRVISCYMCEIAVWRQSPQHSQSGAAVWGSSVACRSRGRGEGTLRWFSCRILQPQLHPF